jgi:hypothetical protein
MSESLRWEPAHEGNVGTLWAFDHERRLVGQVAFYDVVAGRGPGWVGYRRGIRVTGRCTSAELASIWLRNVHLGEHSTLTALRWAMGVSHGEGQGPCVTASTRG